MINDDYMCFVLDFYEFICLRFVFVVIFFVIIWLWFFFYIVDFGWGYLMSISFVCFFDCEVIFFIFCGKGRRSVKILFVMLS